MAGLLSALVTDRQPPNGRPSLTGVAELAAFMSYVTCQRASRSLDFGPGYSSPKKGNVARAVEIGIPMPATELAVKALAVSVRASRLGVDPPALVARLRRMGRRNRHQRNASDIGLVSQKLPELIKRPAIAAAALRFGTRLAVGPLANAAQVLQRQSSVLLPGAIDQRARDLVVDGALVASLPPGEPSQEPGNAPGALAGLQRRPSAGEAVADGLQALTAPRFALACGGNVAAAEVHPFNLGRVARFLGRNFHRHLQVVATIAAFDQRGRGRFLPLQQRPLVVAQLEWERYCPIQQCDSGTLRLQPELKGPRIQRQAGWPEALDLVRRPLGLDGHRHAPNGLASVVGLQTRSRADRSIAQVMKLGFVLATSALGLGKNVVTCIDKRIQRSLDARCFTHFELAGYGFRLQLSHLSTFSNCSDLEARSETPRSAQAAWGLRA